MFQRHLTKFAHFILGWLFDGDENFSDCLVYSNCIKFSILVYIFKTSTYKGEFKHSSSHITG